MTTFPSEYAPVFPAGLSLRTGLLIAAAVIAVCAGCGALKPGGDGKPWALPLFQSGERRGGEPAAPAPDFSGDPPEG